MGKNRMKQIATRWKKKVSEFEADFYNEFELIFIQFVGRIGVIRAVWDAVKIRGVTMGSIH